MVIVSMDCIVNMPKMWIKPCAQFVISCHFAIYKERVFRKL